MGPAREAVSVYRVANCCSHVVRILQGLVLISDASSSDTEVYIKCKLTVQGIFLWHRLAGT